MPSVNAHIMKDAQFILERDEWVERDGLTLVQVEVSMSFYGSDTIQGIGVVDTVKYRNGELSRNGRKPDTRYHAFPLTEDEKASYLAQARDAIREQLEAELEKINA